MGAVAFISHVWLGRGHPDPRGVKLSLLKEIVRRIQAGELEIKTQWMQYFQFGSLAISARALKSSLAEGYIWMDIASIPQRNPEAQGRAIRSIASYVHESSYFFVLAGAWQHEDGTGRDAWAWRRRGWCRLEALANTLSPGGAKPLILIQSPSAIAAYGKHS